MMIIGYFIRQAGERWQLIGQDERYGNTVVLDGLLYDRAAKLYWRYMRECLKERAKRERQPEPTLFPLKVNARTVSRRKAADRFAQPSLFEL